MRKKNLTLSELFREVIRRYMEERDCRRRDRPVWLRSRQVAPDDTGEGSKWCFCDSKCLVRPTSKGEERPL